MKAAFDGQDYMIILDDELDEWSKLGERDAELTASLQKLWEEGLWENKKVRLRIQENSGTDGIEVTYSPEGAESWEAIEQINVAIAWRSYILLGIDQMRGSRYIGSDKIEIFKSDPAGRRTL